MAPQAIDRDDWKPRSLPFKKDPADDRAGEQQRGNLVVQPGP